MKIVRPFHTALLALLLLLSQQMGISHALSHLASQPDSRSEQQLPLDKACDQCLAFASIGSALTGADALTPAAILAAGVFVAVPGPRYFPVLSRAFDSRAPPLTI